MRPSPAALILALVPLALALPACSSSNSAATPTAPRQGSGSSEAAPDPNSGSGSGGEAAPPPAAGGESPAAQEPPQDTPEEAPVGNIRIDTPFSLRAGETADIPAAELRLTFTAVVTDSRCPIDVQCVWAGEVTVELAVTHRGEDRGPVRLTLPGSAQKSAEHRVGDHVVRLTEVQPPPVSTRKLELEDYILTLEVGTGGGGSGVTS